MTLEVLQVNTQDSQGGAAQIMQQLHHGYEQVGVHGSIACGIKYTDDADVHLIDPEARHNRFTKLMMSAAKKTHNADFKGSWHLGNSFEAISNPAKAYDAYRGHEDFHQHGAWDLLDITGRDVDVLQLHNLHGKNYFDLTALPYLTNQVPTFVTMHDAWLLAGHCAHSMGCERWQTGCGSCPDLSLPPRY